jgi:hypothetical protein
VREALQQIGSPALHQTRRAMHDVVLHQAGRLELGALDRERNARVAGDVLQLAQSRVQVPGDDLVVVQADPCRTCGEPSGLRVTRCPSALDSTSFRASSGSLRVATSPA